MLTFFKMRQNTFNRTAILFLEQVQGVQAFFDVVQASRIKLHRFQIITQIIGNICQTAQSLFSAFGKGLGIGVNARQVMQKVRSLANQIRRGAAFRGTFVNSHQCLLTQRTKRFNVHQACTLRA